MALSFGMNRLWMRKDLIAMQKACAKKVKDEFSNYSARFNTPAKLNNFTLTFDEIR